MNEIPKEVAEAMYELHNFCRKFGECSKCPLLTGNKMSYFSCYLSEREPGKYKIKESKVYSVEVS